MLVITKIFLARCQKLKEKFPPVYSPLVGVLMELRLVTSSGYTRIYIIWIGSRNLWTTDKIYWVPIMVEEVFTKDVIKGSMSRWDVSSDIVLKYFPDDSATMMTEIRAYEALKPVQGCVVPRFISVFSVGGYRGRAIGISAVEGITLRQHFKEEAPSIEFFRSVLDQLQAVHNCGVAHKDIRDENIIIKPDRSVVFIDFGNSVVNPVKSFRIDRDALVRTFVREGLDEQTALVASGRIAKVHKIPDGRPLRFFK